MIIYDARCYGGLLYFVECQPGLRFDHFKTNKGSVLPLFKTNFKVPLHRYKTHEILMYYDPAAAVCDNGSGNVCIVANETSLLKVSSLPFQDSKFLFAL